MAWRRSPDKPDAPLLSGSAANGLRFRLKDGGGFYVWYSDQLGNTALQHFKGLIDQLHTAGIPFGAQEETLRAIFPPCELA